jgi:hypothetical protein
MMEIVPHDFTEKTAAIVRFGPGGFPTDGFRPAEYYTVTIDPSQVSPSGQMIRFGANPGDEITGWQRCAAIHVVEVLGVGSEVTIGHDKATLPVIEE